MSSEDDSDAFEQFLEDQKKKVNKRYIYEEDFEKMAAVDDFVVDSSEDSSSDCYNEDDEVDEKIFSDESGESELEVKEFTKHNEQINKVKYDVQFKKDDVNSSNEESDDPEQMNIIKNLTERRKEKSKINASPKSSEDASSIKRKKKKYNQFAYKKDAKLSVLNNFINSSNSESSLFSNCSISAESSASDIEEGFKTTRELTNVSKSKYKEDEPSGKAYDLLSPITKQIKEVFQSTKDNFKTPKRLLNVSSVTLIKNKKVAPLQKNNSCVTPSVKLSKKVAQTVPSKKFNKLLKNTLQESPFKTENESIFTDSDEENVSPFRTPSLFKSKKNLLRMTQTVPSKQRKKLDFISSLMNDVDDEIRDYEAVRYRRDFKKLKKELALKIYHVYNEHVFLDKLPFDIDIQWHKRLRNTAGVCCCAFDNIRERTIRIKLSIYVLTDTERLLETLMHEMCHGAVWIINKCNDNHGPIWKVWASECYRIFPGVPLTSRCHDYDISSKYEYWCLTCNNVIKRHSKSLDVTGNVCGHCGETFTLFVNDSNGTKKIYEENQTLAGFQKFVKENYKMYRVAGISHGEVMKTLSSKYAFSKDINEVANLITDLTVM